MKILFILKNNFHLHSACPLTDLLSLVVKVHLSGKVYGDLEVKALKYIKQGACYLTAKFNTVFCNLTGPI